MNEYTNLIEALQIADTRLDEGALLGDGATNWDIDNLIEALKSNGYSADEDGNTYCVGYDGSVGQCDGDNVTWIYRVVS